MRVFPRSANAGAVSSNQSVVTALALEQWCTESVTPPLAAVAGIARQAAQSPAPPMSIKDVVYSAILTELVLAACVIGQLDVSSHAEENNERTPVCARAARYVLESGELAVTRIVPELTADTVSSTCALVPCDIAARSRVIAAGTETAAIALGVASFDRRIVAKCLPGILAGLFQVTAWGTAADVGAMAACTLTFAKLTTAESARTVAGSLLPLLSGSFLRGFAVSMALSKMLSNAVSPLRPSSPNTAPSATRAPESSPDWLRRASGAELCRLAARTERGVEAIFDAMLDAVDAGGGRSNDAVVSERALAAAAAALAAPPPSALPTHSETAIDVAVYYAALWQQLRRLLRIVGGSRAVLLRRGAAATLAAIVAVRSQWRAVLTHVLQPLAAPLVEYALPRGSPREKDGVRPQRRELASADAVLGAVEDLHALLAQSSRAAALYESTEDAIDSGTRFRPLPLRVVASLSACLPALLDLKVLTGRARLRAGAAAATAECAVRLLAALPTQWAARAVLAYAGALDAHGTDSNMDVSDDDAYIDGVDDPHKDKPKTAASNTTVSTVQAVALTAMPTFCRHPACRYALADNGAYRLVEEEGPIDDESALAGTADLPQVALPQLLLHRPNSHVAAAHRAPIGSGGAMNSLLHITGDFAAGEQISSSRSGADSRRNAHSGGLDGGAGSTMGHAGAERANAVVDVLLAGSGCGCVAECNAVATNVFTSLLRAYARAQINALSISSKPQSVSPLCGAVTTGGNFILPVPNLRRDNEPLHRDLPIGGLQLLICMSERIGPSLLTAADHSNGGSGSGASMKGRSAVRMLRALRDVLLMSVVSLRLPIPQADTVGLVPVLLTKLSGTYSAPAASHVGVDAAAVAAWQIHTSDVAQFEQISSVNVSESSVAKVGTSCAPQAGSEDRDNQSIYSDNAPRSVKIAALNGRRLIEVIGEDVGIDSEIGVLGFDDSSAQKGRIPIVTHTNAEPALRSTSVPLGDLQLRTVGASREVTELISLLLALLTAATTLPDDLASEARHLDGALAKAGATATRISRLPAAAKRVHGRLVDDVDVPPSDTTTRHGDPAALHGSARAHSNAADATQRTMERAAFRARALLLSTLPLLAALSSHFRVNHFVESREFDTGDGSGVADADADERDVRESAAALRSLLLTMPSPRDPSVPKATGRASPLLAPLATASTADIESSGGDVAAYRAAMELVMHSATPIQAHGLRQLARLLRSEAPSSVMAAPPGARAGDRAALRDPRHSAMFDLFFAQLSSGDAALTGAAVEGLVALAGAQSAAVIPLLLDAVTPPERRADNSGGADAGLALRVRVRVGEALHAALTHSGEGGTLGPHVPTALAVGVEVGMRSGWHGSRELIDELRAAGRVHAPLQMQASGSVSEATAVTPGRSTYDIALALADWTDLRCSALACLGVVLLHASAGAGGAASASSVPSTLRQSSVVDAVVGLVDLLRGPTLAAVGSVARDAGFATDGAPLAVLTPSLVLPATNGAAANSDSSRSAGAVFDDDVEALTLACAVRVRRTAALALRDFVDGVVGAESLARTAALPPMGPVVAVLRHLSASDTDAVTRTHARDALVALGLA